MKSSLDLWLPEEGAEESARGSPNLPANVQMMSPHPTHPHMGYCKPRSLSYNSFIDVMLFPRHLLGARLCRPRAGHTGGCRRESTVQMGSCKLNDSHRCVLRPDADRPARGSEGQMQREQPGET